MKTSVLTILLYLAALSCVAQQANPNTAVNEEPIPFKLDSHIYLQATVDGNHNINLIFDTGASGQLVVDTLCIKEQEWQLNNLRKAKTSGANGTSTVSVSMATHTVKTGATTTTFPYMILMGVRDIVGRYADGIIGSKDFTTHPYEINYQHRFVRGLNAIPDSVKKLYQCIPLVVENSKYMIQAKVWFNGKCIDGLYNIDTGSGNVIDFTAETTRKYALDAYKGVTHIGHGLQMGVGNGDESTWIDALADSMHIGTLAIANPEITLNPTGKGAFATNIFIGNIGAGILENYNLVFDVPNGKLYIRPFKSYKPDEKSYGMTWLNRTDIGKGWIVRSLYNESPAYKSGIKLGDTITEVNGKKVEEYSWDEETHLSGDTMIVGLSTKEGQKTITLTKEKLY